MVWTARGSGAFVEAASAFSCSGEQPARTSDTAIMAYGIFISRHLLRMYPPKICPPLRQLPAPSASDSEQTRTPDPLMRSAQTFRRRLAPRQRNRGDGLPHPEYA